MSDNDLTIDAEPIGRPRIERLSISGFQGDRKFSIKFKDHVNFLIGRNGCGKTTLINIINAALTGDAQSLLRSRFSELRITLTLGGNSTRYTLLYTKEFSEAQGAFSLNMSILGPREGELASRRVREREREQALYRNEYGHLVTETPRPMGWRAMFGAAHKPQPLVTWLSILRWDLNRSGSPGELQANPIDKKLEDLTVRSSRFLTSLDTRSSILSSQFQKDYYLSLIGYKQDSSVIIESFRALNLAHEEQMLERILTHLNIPIEDFQDRSRAHFTKAREVRRKSNSTYNLDEVLCILDSLRIHELNEKWLAFDRGRAEIYRPKTEFIEIMNSLFVDKALSFDDRNQPIFTLPNGRNLRITGLSSGEKQAYIILSEALVQEASRAIYLADEPELSLHIEWQQYLVRHLMSLNPNCQLIFATHSPDILGEYGSNAIDLEAI